MDVRLRKDERLHLKKEIDLLFTSGRSFVVYPFRVVWRLSDASGGNPPASILVSIPKKRFKRAVWRNRLRRRTREACRLNKEQLWARLPAGQTLHLALLYISSEPEPYSLIERKIQEIFTRLADVAAPAARHPSDPQQTT